MLQRPLRVLERYPLVQDPPFSLDGVGAYLFAIPCSPAALAALVTHTFGWAAPAVVVSPLGSVCLFVFTHTSKASAADPSRGSFAYHELAVFVPVLVERPGQLPALAMHLPFIYPDQGLAVAAGREIYGMPKKPADISFPDDPSTFWNGPAPLAVSVLGAKQFDGSAWSELPLLSVTSRAQPSLVTQAENVLLQAIDSHLGPLPAALAGLHLLQQNLVQLKQVPDVTTGGLQPRVLYRAVTAPFESMSNIQLADASQVTFTLQDLASEPLRDVLGLPETFSPLVAASLDMSFGFDDGRVLLEQPEQTRVPEVRTRVVILGGGMGALATAYALTATPDRRARFDVRVVAQGQYLGGKGASHRDPDPAMGSRSLEHGLHVFFGFYHNALRMMRDVYTEAHRPPTSVPATFDGAFQPNWDVTFSNGTDSYDATFPHTPADNGVLARSANDRLEVLKGLLDNLTDGAVSRLFKGGPLTIVAEAVKLLEGILDNVIFRQILAFGITLAKAILDDVVLGGKSFDDLDVYDFREWMKSHHILGFPDLSATAIMQVPYDGVFAYDGTTTDNPRLGAGIAARGLLQLVTDYEIAPTYIMQAGMGECVFGPLYEVLLARGVRFEMFAKVTELTIDGDTATKVTYARQAVVTNGPFAYEPTYRLANGVVAWRGDPDPAQLAAGSPILGQDPYSDAVDVHVGPDPELLVTRDFDVLVCALPAPVTASVLRGHQGNPTLVAIAKIPTVCTLQTQLWLNGTTPSLGWAWRAPVLGGFPQPLDTMHLRDPQLGVEEWPPASAPGGLLYLCGPFTPGYRIDSADPAARTAAGVTAMAEAVTFVTNELGKALPSAVVAGSNPPVFDFTTLYRPGGVAPVTPLGAQYVRYNIDLSQQYVLCWPGGLADRPTPVVPGVTNLVFAGDWTRNGVDIPCIEGTVVSALLAAEAITGEDLDILG
jgi:uncharacterized protein with NAD-binding domain and iron-sulfur cluster